jgi:hypothetical protein
MKLRDCIKTAWLGIGASALLIVWQLMAYVTDSIPNHILPLVRLLSGTQEAVPVAYSWTIWIGVFSALGFVVSLAALVCLYLLSRLRRNDHTPTWLARSGRPTNEL